MEEECYGDEIECPYCGWKDRDSWEWGSGNVEEDGTADCGECEREFYVSKSCSITYVTKPKPMGPEKPVTPPPESPGS
jgi:hypothetical protein